MLLKKMDHHNRISHTCLSFLFSLLHIFLQTVSVDHDSVVARPTYARTMQIENTHLPDHLTATLPSTVNAKGVTISNVVHPAFKNQEGGNGNGNVNFTNSNIGDTGSFQPGEFGEISSPSTRSRTNNNKVVEIDVPGGNRGRLNGNSVGFVSTPVSPDRSVRSLTSNNGERTGEHPF